MSSLNKGNTLAQAHMCQCGDCNNIYYTTPLVSNRWGVRVECCSYTCYLRSVNTFGSKETYGEEYKNQYKNNNPSIPTQELIDETLKVPKAKIFLLIIPVSEDNFLKNYFRQQA